MKALARAAKKFLIREKILLTLIAVSCVGLSVWLSNLAKEEIYEADHNHFQITANLALEDFALNIGVSLESLHGVRQLYYSSEAVTREEFHTFTAPILNRHLNLKNLAWSPRVSQTGRTVFENRAQNEGYPDFRIRERDFEGNLVPAAARREYFPVYFWSAKNSDDRIAGFDVASDPAMRDALQQARDTNDVIMTSRITPMKGKEARDGFLAFLPVYRKGASLATEADRRKNIEGFVIGHFIYEDIFERSLSLHTLGHIDDVDFFLFDLSAGLDAELLYSKNGMVQGLDNLSGRATISREIGVGGRRWLAVMAPHGGHLYEATPWLRWILLAGLLVISGLLTFSVHAGMKQINQAREVFERDARLRSIMDNVFDGILTIDGQGAIEATNITAQRLFGYSSEDLENRDIRTVIPDLDISCFEPCVANSAPAGTAGTARTTAHDVGGVRRDGTSLALDLAVCEIWLGDERKFLCLVRDITERKRTADELNRLAERLRLATEAAKIGIWERDVVRNTKLWDRRMHEIYGLPQKGYRNTVQDWLDVIHPDDRERTVAEVETTLAGGEELHTNFRVVRPDGHVRYIESHGLVQRDSDGAATRMTGVAIDVTTRVEAERVLRESEARYRDLIEASPLGIQIGARDRDSVYNNRAAIELFGYDSVEELLNTPSLRLVADHDRERIASYRAAFFRGEYIPRSYEFDGVRKDGSIVPLQVYPRRIVWGGEEAMQRTYVDLTERKRAEAQLRQSQKMDSLGNLAGGIAHELNNMLLPIQALTELTIDRISGDSIAYDNLKAVLRTTKRASELVDKILSFSHQQEAERKPVDLREIVEQQLTLFDSTVPKTITVKKDLSRTPITVMADETQLHQILMNLASNAVHAIDGKIGELTVALAAVDLRNPDECSRLGLSAGAYAKLSVRDTGCGMESRTLERIFEPFYTTKDVGVGTGMGLAVIHGIVTAHGGVIDVSSRPAVGTEFDIYLPVFSEEALALAGNG